jgi:predicted nucleic acid-binding protein
MTKIYISDTNIWIDFRNAGLLVEVFQLPFTLCCTDFVLHELADLPRDLLIERGLQVETLDEVAISALFTLKVDHNNSSLADVSCYYLARQTGFPLLTGDGRLRKQASKDGLQVFGALWVLDRLVEHAVIQPLRAADALAAMLLHGARLPSADCHSRLDLWRSGTLPTTANSP